MTNKEKTLKNLRKVYNELPKIAETKKHIIGDFTMSIFGCAQYLEIDHDLNTFCNTQGCLLGNIIYVFPEATKDDSLYYKDALFNYNLFSEKYFPYVELNSSNWYFLFSGLWDEYQPTFNQAMERLKYYLDHNGDIPEWEYQKESFIK